MSARALKHFLLVFIWLFAANHCFAANLTESQHQSAKNHDCCGDHGHKGSKNSNDSADRHASCDDEGCCQPVVKGAENSSLSKSNILVARWIPVDWLSCKSPSKTFTVDTEWPLASAPPRLNPLFSSRQSAPNAPPLFS